MPRLPPWLLRQARRHSPNLAALVPACRDIQSAKNELRWLTEYVKGVVPQTSKQIHHLKTLCHQRGRGVPLQYILGSQPFGPLDIKCRPGVLIPRPETEAYTYHLAELIKTGELLGQKPSNGKGTLGIVDFCTGTGCIPLLLHTLLQHSFHHLRVRGVDIAPDAVDLARLNVAHNTSLGNILPPETGKMLGILRGDIFNDKDITSLAEYPCDVLVSNPPYVSQKAWDYGHGQLGYSVRKYEPRLALVPSHDLHLPPGWQHEDVFYSRLMDIAGILRPRAALFELGDEAQARRVLSRLFQHELSHVSTVEVWRNWPDVTEDGQVNELVIDAGSTSRRIPVKGSGHIRSIVLKLHRRS